jgi:hypothetical protein
MRTASVQRIVIFRKALVKQTVRDQSSNLIASSCYRQWRWNRWRRRAEKPWKLEQRAPKPNASVAPMASRPRRRILLSFTAAPLGSNWRPLRGARGDAAHGEDGAGCVLCRMALELVGRFAETPPFGSLLLTAIQTFCEMTGSWSLTAIQYFPKRTLSIGAFTNNPFCFCPPSQVQFLKRQTAGDRLKLLERETDASFHSQASISPPWLVHTATDRSNFWKSHTHIYIYIYIYYLITLIKLLSTLFWPL